MKALGVIPARGGSKGLLRKNMEPFAGRPLIYWTYSVAAQSELLDGLIVSSDCEEIVDYAKTIGARVPFVRPEYLAVDEASSIDVVLHAVDYLAKIGEVYDIVVMLEPTSPLREVNDIDDAVRSIKLGLAKSVVSICEAEACHPAFLFEKAKNELIKPIGGKYPNNLRRQELSPKFFVEGTIYASLVELLREKKGFYHSETVGSEVPKWKSLEIDDIDDFVMAEALFLSRIKGAK